MTTALVNEIHRNSTDAEFRAWGLAISTALSTVGLVQTADTGQVNWTTVVKPAGASTIAGYEVWRFNDAQQSGAPIFLKVEYGSAAAATSPRVTITVGQGSNGSGSLTGTVSTAQVWSANGSTATAILTGVSFAEGCLSLSLAETGGGTYRPGVIQLGRFLDTSGAPTTRGYYFVRVSNSLASTYYTYLLASGVWTTNPSTIPIFWPYGVATSVKFGTGIFVAPFLIGSGDNTHGAMERTLGLVQAGTVDFPASATYAMDRWDGASHTYRATGVNDVSASGCYFGILWE